MYVYSQRGCVGMDPSCFGRRCPADLLDMTNEDSFTERIVVWSLNQLEEDAENTNENSLE